MNCNEFLELSPLEKSNLIGSVVHCLQSDAELFKMAIELAQRGKEKGLFEKVKINPHIPETNLVTE
jgi:hypothetical protein